MSAPEILTVLTIVIALPLNWIVTILLWRVSHAAPDVQVLRERAGVALALSVIVTVFGLIFLNNDLKPPLLDFESTKLFTRGVLFVMATVPALLWLRLYRASK